ncbi:MAG: Gfo/Idh/MocA family oxidoreductase [Phycisphaeraceae bacterium]
MGISGLGRSGWGIHADAIQAMVDRYTVAAVYDPNAGRCQSSAEALGCTAHASLETMLADPDVELVIVASPNAHHAPQAEQALRAGKHVLCEKPFGLTVADVDAMIAASEASGKVLQPFQQRRYAPDIRKVMDVISSGVLGEITFARIAWHGFKRRWDWQTLTECSGGDLNNNGPHVIDHAMELFGEDEPDVWCERRRCLASGDAEDHVKIILRGPGNPTVEVELSSVFAYSQDRWLVCGTSGALRGTGEKLEWKWVDWSTMPERPVQPESTPDRSYNSEKLPWQSETWSAGGDQDAGAGAAPAKQPVFDLYTDLYRSVREGAAQTITPQSVRRRVGVMEAARAASSIEPVAVKAASARP